MTKKSASSQQWLRRQHKDPFVKQAQAMGLRSRASFKLQDIQNKYHVIHKNDVVVDLGASPGSWSEAAAMWVGTKGKVIACDLLEMRPIGGVDFIQGDFTELEVQANLKARVGGSIDVVISDMAPNFIGVSKADLWAAVGLNETVLAFCDEHLKTGGHLVMKCFQGDGIEALMQSMRQSFTKLHMLKPESSRKDSKECFAVALGLKR